MVGIGVALIKWTAQEQTTYFLLLQEYRIYHRLFQCLSLQKPNCGRSKAKKKKKYLLRAKTPQNGRQQCAANKADTVSRFSIKISRQSNKYFIAHLPENFTDELPVKRF